MFTYDENLFSDFYKDTYGFRPRGHEFYEASPERKQQIWDQLWAAHDREVEEERLRLEQAVFEFEARVAETIACGAMNREHAIRWMLQAEQPDEHDLTYGGSWVCWKWGLPYSMQSEFDAVCNKMLREEYVDA